MDTTDLETIIDADGHVFEDNAAIVERLPSFYKEHGVVPQLGIFPPLDHFHAAHPGSTPGSRARRGKRIGPEEWIAFMNDVGLDSTVLYPTYGLAYGRIVHRDWAIDICQAYNDWLYETYMKHSPRFRAVGLIPMQEPEAAIEELRRIVLDLGMKGAMLPANGLHTHLGAKEYWPVYAEADRLGCTMAVHGGCYGGLGMDTMNVYGGVHAFGQPFGQMLSLSGLAFNGLFDKCPNVRWAFLEGGVAWFLFCLERFDRAHATHQEHHRRAEELGGPQIGERVSDYLRKHIEAGRVFIGCEGSEEAISFAVQLVGSKPFVFSSDFPHEVTAEMCKEELHEVMENEGIDFKAKEAVLKGNAERLYQIQPVAV